MDKILDRIEQRLRDVGMSASAASLAAGLSKDAIRNIRRSRSQGLVVGVNVRTLEALAPVLRTTKSWLLGEESGSLAKSETSVAFCDLEKLPSKKRDILKGLGKVDVTLGDLSFPTPRRSVILTRLSDESMNRVIPKGSLVLTDLSQVELERHRIYVVSLSSGEVVVRTYEEKPDRLVPSSVLPDYESYFDMHSVEVVGRAVAVYNEL